MALNHEMFFMKIFLLREFIYETNFSFLREAMTL